MGNQDSKTVSNLNRSSKENESHADRGERVFSTNLGTSVDGPETKSVARQQAEVSRLSGEGAYQFESRNYKGGLISDTNVVDEQQRKLNMFKEANLASKEDAEGEASEISEKKNSISNENEVDNLTFNICYFNSGVTNNSDSQQSNSFSAVDKTVVEKSDKILQRSKSTDKELFKKTTSSYAEIHATVRSKTKHLFNKGEQSMQEADNNNRTRMNLHFTGLDTVIADSSNYVESTHKSLCIPTAVPEKDKKFYKLSKVSEKESEPESRNQNQREMTASDYSGFSPKTATTPISVNQVSEKQFQHEKELHEPTNSENKMVLVPADSFEIQLGSNGMFNRKLTVASNDNRLTLQMDGSEDEISEKNPYGIYTNVMFLPDKSKGASPKRYGPKKLGMQPVVLVSAHNSESQSDSSRLSSLNSEDVQNLNVDNALEQPTNTEYVVPKLNLQTLSSAQSSSGTECFKNDFEFMEDHFGLFTGAVACGVIDSCKERAEGIFCEGGHGCEASCATESVNKSGFSTNEMEGNNPQFTQGSERTDLCDSGRQFGSAKRLQSSSDTLQVLNNDDATKISSGKMQPDFTSDASQNHSDKDVFNSLKDNAHISIDEQNCIRSKCNAVSYPTFGKNCHFDIDWNILQSRQGRFAKTLKSSNTNIAEDNRFCMEFSLPFKCGVLEDDIERLELPNKKGSGLHTSIKEISTSYEPCREFMDNDLDELSDDSEVCTETAVSVFDLDDEEENNSKEEHKKSELFTSELQKINTEKSLQLKREFQEEEENTPDETNGPYAVEQSQIGVLKEEGGSILVNKVQKVGGHKVMETENKEIASVEKAAVISTDNMNKTESQKVAPSVVTEDFEIGLVRNKEKSENEIMNRDLSTNSKKMDTSENTSVTCSGILSGSKSFQGETGDFQKVYKRKKTKPEHDNRLVVIDEDDSSSRESSLLSGMIAKLGTIGRKPNTLFRRKTQHKHGDMFEFMQGIRGLGSDMGLDFSLPPHKFHRQLEKHRKRMIKKLKTRDRHELSKSSDMMKTSTNKNLSDEREKSKKQKEETFRDEFEEFMVHERKLHRFLMDSDNDSDGSISSDREDNGEDGIARLYDGEWKDLLDQETVKCCQTMESPSKLRCTVVCVDISESMIGEPWLQMREALQEFVLGLEDVKTKYGTTELVSLVTFGHATEVALTPTTDYSEVMDTFDKLEAKGNSPLAAVLMLTLFPVLESTNDRYRFRMFSQNVRHRAILMSDFCATPHNMLCDSDVVTDGQARHAAEEVKRRMKSLCSQGLKSIMNIHCVPIGLGPNMEIVEFIVQKSGGQIVPSTDIHRLCTNTRNYMNSLQITKHVIHSGSKTLDTKLLHTIITTLYPDSSADDVRQMTSEVEVEFKIHKKQEEREKKKANVSGKESRVDETVSDSEIDSDDDTKSHSSENDTFAEVEGMPAIGTRVERGPDFNPKKIVVVSKQGTITGHCVKREACLYVHWDCGVKTVCRYGKMDCYDVSIVQDDKKHIPCRLEDKIKVGHRVRQGPGWQYGDQDGGSDQLGTVFHVYEDAVRVRWDNGNRGLYRYNYQGAYDVLISTPDDPFDIQRYTHEMNRRNLAKTRGIDINAAVHYRHEKLDIDLSESLFGLDLDDFGKGQKRKLVNKNALCHQTVDATDQSSSGSTPENLDIPLD